MLLIVPPNSENDPETSSLVQAAECLDWSVYKAEPRWKLPNGLIGQEGAVYGRGNGYFCQVIADQMNWELLSNPMDWLTYLMEEYVRRNIVMSTLGSVRALTEKKFIKPAEEDRLFPASVYEDGSKLPALKTFDSAPVLVSGTIPYTIEWRCFVKDRAVVSVSCYRHGLDKDKSSIWNDMCSEPIEFLNKFLANNDSKCMPSTVDIGRSKKGHLSIIESSPAYTAHLYGCERVGTLSAIKASCVMKDQSNAG